MTFDQIETFYLIATLGTYRKATERLNATQPTLSARIAALEDRLGVTLFDRGGHRVALTPQGRQFLVYAEKLLQTRAEARRAGSSSGHSARTCCGAVPTTGCCWWTAPSPEVAATGCETLPRTCSRTAD